MKISWRFGIIAGFIVALFGLYPQFVIISERGNDWNGVFASNDLDEAAYAAYLQALIDGRPRKNDPYSGRDETPGNPQYESIFSIQFAAPYLAAVPARLAGLNAPQAFIAIYALAAFFTALALFWLIVQITGDERFASVAVLLVLFGGALAAGNGVLNEFLGSGAPYPFLPFLRRYIPAVAFPFFFAVFGFTWLALKSEVRTTKYIAAVLTGFCFAFTVFSYFYLWTTAGAFLFLVTFFWLIVRPENWKRDLKFLLLADLFAFLSLLPYAYLLSKRGPDIDAVQLLVYTHAPDMFRVPAVVCYFALAILAFSIWIGFTKLRNAQTIFLLAFSLVPLIVFNQQIVTGRSLQPFHYEFYVVNYLTALVAILTVYLFLKKLATKKIYAGVLFLIALAGIGWGYLEVKYTTNFLVYWNVARDEAMPVSKRLVELALADEKDGRLAVTLNYDYVQADNQPSLAPQAVLWARHQHVFAGVSWEENKERYYQMTYYAGRDADWLRENFRQGDIEAYMALFGWDRFNARLSVNARPLTAPEIEQEVQRYKTFYENFGAEHASNPELSFVVVPNKADIDLTNLQKWYDLGAGEDFGEFTLYRLALKRMGGKEIGREGHRETRR